MASAVHRHRPSGPELITIAGSEVFPGSAWPVLFHRSVRLEHPSDAAATHAEAFEAMFEQHGWRPAWRDVIYDFDHYHSTAHEALALASGSVILQLGGNGGVTVHLHADDVIVLPAGVAHRSLESSRDLCIVGAYPPGQQPDLLRADVSRRDAAAARIAKIPAPPRDPVDGRAYPPAPARS